MAFRSFCLGFLILGFSLKAGAEDTLRTGGFGQDALGLISEAKGFLKAEGLRTDYFHASASIELMQNFANGKIDVVHTSSDNVIAWAEGQGADKKTHDFILFMGGQNGLDSTFVVPPEVKSFVGLKGKVLAVDAYNTGYAPVLVYLLRKNGLILNKDYQLKPVGGGNMRREAVKKGEAFAALMTLDGDLERRGYYMIARAQDYFSDYARGDGAARRDWAQQNEDLLVRYIRARIRATDWLLDPKNEGEAIQVMTSALQGAADEARQLYRDALDPRIGLIPRGKPNVEGVKMILELRKVMGEMKDPLPPPSKYIEERYYQKAFATLRDSGMAN